MKDKSNNIDELKKSLSQPGPSYTPETPAALKKSLSTSKSSPTTQRFICDSSDHPVGKQRALFESQEPRRLNFSHDDHADKKQESDEDKK